ncbi:hypothetical protein J6I39_00380 [bacterium]|nr:hypothetical protein [bacterium]
MKKIILLLALSLLAVNFINTDVQASLVSSGKYRQEQNRVNKAEAKQIKELFKVHETFANKHDLSGLKTLYADNYVNSDGMKKDIYFKTVEETWEECKDLTYTSKILSIDINGKNATVSMEEGATGTIYDKADTIAVAGEIHAKSTSIYHLVKINGKWLISGETMLSDESALLYGDARFMNIELLAPNQVSSGETYTISVTADADDNTVIVGSLEHDPVVYPTQTPNAPLRTMPKTHILERYIKANTDNINEYAVASLAISKSKSDNIYGTKIYMAGIACIMKRVNVVPKNNFAKLEDKK